MCDDEDDVMKVQVVTFVSCVLDDLIDELLLVV